MEKFLGDKKITNIPLWIFQYMRFTKSAVKGKHTSLESYLTYHLELVKGGDTAMLDIFNYTNEQRNQLVTFIQNDPMAIDMIVNHACRDIVLAPNDYYKMLLIAKANNFGHQIGIDTSNMKWMGDDLTRLDLNEASYVDDIEYKSNINVFGLKLISVVNKIDPMAFDISKRDTYWNQNFKHIVTSFINNTGIGVDERIQLSYDESNKHVFKILDTPNLKVKMYTNVHNTRNVAPKNLQITVESETLSGRTWLPVSNTFTYEYPATIGYDFRSYHMFIVTKLREALTKQIPHDFVQEMQMQLKNATGGIDIEEIKSFI